MTFGRRKLRRDWTPVEVIGDVETAFFGDADGRTVRAATVLRHAYERMPKSEVSEWEAIAAAEPPPSSLKSHVTFMFDFADEDSVALYMDHYLGILVRGVQTADGLDEAKKTALKWVGEPHTETDITHVPGVYQAAMIEAVTGVPRFWEGGETMGWWLPGQNGPPYVYRRYPPTDKDEPEFRLMLMPADVKRSRYVEFLASPSVDAEMKQLSGAKRRFRLRR